MKNSIFRFVSQKYCINHCSHSYDKISDENVKEDLLIFWCFIRCYSFIKGGKRGQEKTHHVIEKAEKNILNLGLFLNHSVLLAPDHGMSPTHSRETMSLVVLFGNSLTGNQEVWLTSLLGVLSPVPMTVNTNHDMVLDMSASFETHTAMIYDQKIITKSLFLYFTRRSSVLFMEFLLCIILFWCNWTK